MLALLGLLWDERTAIAVALVWAAHIGLDRTLGYGLKYDEGFGFTHLGRVGKRLRRSSLIGGAATSVRWGSKRGLRGHSVQ